MAAGTFLDDRNGPAHLAQCFEVAQQDDRIGSRGMTIGEPLDAFQGVLRGVPTYLGASQPLLQDDIR